MSQFFINGGGGGGGGGGYTWNNEYSDYSAIKSNGYFNNSSLHAALPSSPALGDSIIFYSNTSDTVIIDVPFGYTIQIGDEESTGGGNASSESLGATLELVYNSDDEVWHAVRISGFWELN